MGIIVLEKRQSPDEEIYGGNVNPGCGTGQRRLEVLSQAPVVIEPCPFDNLAARQHFESDGGLTISIVQLPNLARVSCRLGPL